MTTDMERTFQEGNLNQVAELLANPARSGVYLTRARIRSVASGMGLRAGIQSRSRMIENLFREAGSENRIEELLELLDAEAARWLEQYRLWSRACPPAKGAWRNWTSRAKELRRQLRQARKWARNLEPEFPENG